MAWFALLLAGFLEIIWALGLKYSDGFTRFWPSVATGVAIVLSFGLLGVSLKTVPFGTAYAVWTGIGAAGAAITGMMPVRRVGRRRARRLPRPDRGGNHRPEARNAKLDPSIAAKLLNVIESQQESPTVRA